MNLVYLLTAIYATCVILSALWWISMKASERHSSKWEDEHGRTESDKQRVFEGKLDDD